MGRKKKRSEFREAFDINAIKENKYELEAINKQYNGFKCASDVQ